MRLRKDKTNTAVYEAMKQTLRHQQVQKILDMDDARYLNIPRKGFDIDYMNVEHRLNQYFTSICKAMIEQSEEKFGKEEAVKIKKRMKKFFGCRGLAYNKKHSHQCHHPFCPLCYHRKHYRTIGDLKPYLKPRNKLKIIILSETVLRDQIDMAMESLEVRSKKITKSLSPHVEQWIRQPHLVCLEEEDTIHYIVRSVIVMIHRASREEEVSAVCAGFQNWDMKIFTKDAAMNLMSPLLCKSLFYDPLLLKHAGSWGIERWDRMLYGFRYRAKHAHR